MQYAVARLSLKTVAPSTRAVNYSLTSLIFSSPKHYNFCTSTKRMENTSMDEEAKSTKKIVVDSAFDIEEEVMPIRKNGLYNNPWSTWKDPQLGAILKWGATRPWFQRWKTQKELDEFLPVVSPQLDKLNNPTSSLQYTWIGHSSVLVQMKEGEKVFNFLTDPVWCERASPFTFAGPKRIRKVPLPISQLPPIDFVVISHNHYDHLDVSFVKEMGDKTKWLVPEGLKVWFNDNGVKNVTELNWWQSHNITDSVKVVCTPTQHWSKRKVHEKNTSLWSSWSIIGNENRVFFAGDTGYCPGFKTIGHKLGPFDLSLIPIGAYCPRHVMKPQHVDPEEAVQMHIDLKSKHSLGIHWGTFILTDEPEDEPPKKMELHAKEKGLTSGEFVVKNIGETFSVKD